MSPDAPVARLGRLARASFAILRCHMRLTTAYVPAEAWKSYREAKRRAKRYPRPPAPTTKVIE